MDMFYALAEPHRRNIIEMLAYQGQLTAGEIASKFSITAAAISQHLKVLKEAQLVIVEKQAQHRLYSINTEKTHELEIWIKKLNEVWDERFDKLDAVLEQEKKKQL